MKRALIVVVFAATVVFPATVYGNWLVGNNYERFWSFGLAFGVSPTGFLGDLPDDTTIYPGPLFLITPQATLSLFRFSFLRLGVGMGLPASSYGPVYPLRDTWSADREHMVVDGGLARVIHPFAHFVIFSPAGRRGLFSSYIGVGGGVYFAEFEFAGFSINRVIPVADFTMGMKAGSAIFWHFSYTMRTDFSSVTSVFSTGLGFRLGMIGR